MIEVCVPEALEAEVVATRRDLHRHPELGFAEHRTAGLVAKRLRSLGYEVYTGIGRTGVVGVLRGAQPGKTIGLRADMDALPIVEETHHAFASQTLGTMHACGHDAHVAILLGSAALAAQRKDELHGTLCLVFQPAEEGHGGAKAMLDDGLLERFGIERMYGLHVMSAHASGTLGFRAGPMYASADLLDIEVLGSGGHASAPNTAIDPICVAAGFVTSVQQVVSRFVDPLEPAVVTIGSIHGGSTHNVIPRTCTMMGTVRTFNETVRGAMPEQIERVLRACCDVSGARYTFVYSRRFPVTANDAMQTAYVCALATALVGADRVFDSERVMGSEDFSFFAQRVPSCYYTLGVRGGDASSHPHHSSSFDLDESALATGVQMMTALALDAARNAP